MLYTVRCSKCGTEQKGLRLKETKCSVVCSNCETQFKVNLEKLKEDLNKKETDE